MTDNLSKSDLQNLVSDVKTCGKVMCNCATTKQVF